MRSAAGHARPESTTADASRFYDAADTAAQYTKAGVTTQSELTQRCLTLLGPLPRVAVLADLGCGSGLSGAVLSKAGNAWLGLDVSRRMLDLAKQHEQSARGAVALADFGDGLPLRAACLDGAVSVSALQWLCVASSGQDAARARCAAFFGALRRALRPGAAAVLQVYCADDSEAELLLSGACSTGFSLPLLCIDFPHATAAKKLFLCVRRPAEGDSETAACLPESSSPACALAWPRRACCAAAWWQRTVCAADGRAAQQRLGDEHIRYARRLVRLMRRGAALREAAGDDDAAGVETAARALAAAFPKGSQRASWCCLRRVASVSALPLHSAAAAVVADALRGAAWEVEVRAAPPEATPQQARFTGHKRDRGNKGGNAASSTNNARKDELRAAAGAPPDAAFVALAHGSCGGVHVGLLLSPDAAPHGAATALLRGDVRATAMRAASAFAHAAGVPVLALDVALRDDGAAKLLLLAAGPIDVQTAAAAAEALSELALS